MNRTLLQEYRTAYRQNFSQIRQEEGYKWRAVQHFQAHWDADADDFAAMLAAALAETSNLMNAGNYYPKRMILKTADANPALVRQAFLELFDENADLEGRMKAFRQHVSALVRQQSPGKNHYQDDRAILVYLTLRYPDNYYFYKFRMLVDFCQKTGYDYRPKKGAFANIETYFAVCNYLKPFLQEDAALMELHWEQSTAVEHFDSSLNILTQDFVYAIQAYLSIPEIESAPAMLWSAPPQTNDLATPLAADAADPDGPERAETTTYRILRDTKKAREIKRSYGYRCQICNATIDLNGRPYSEAHHIKPLGNPHNGPDHPSNIISVCPNHHVMLDYFAIELDMARLTLHPPHQLNPEYVAYHNAQYHKGKNN
jgi:hypothetical protein